MKSQLLVLLIPCAVLAACGRAETPATSDPAAATGATPATGGATTPAGAASPAAALVMLAGKSGRSVMGELQLSASAEGVSMTGEVSGLTQGSEHGIHFHEKGDCSSGDAESAGAHFNPANMKHGSPTATEKHVGDLPNIKSDEAGRATVTVAIPGATLRDGGPQDLVGRSLVIHAQRDDYVTQPAGNSGARIACGVVG